jgi:glycine cleavage system aminomethyltransferase T
VGLTLVDDRLPIAGSQVLEAAGSDGTDAASTTGSVVGAVTSSCLSPMLGGKAVAFAMVKWGTHEHGTTVAVPAEGQMVSATVGPLASLKSQTVGR